MYPSDLAGPSVPSLTDPILFRLVIPTIESVHLDKFVTCVKRRRIFDLVGTDDLSCWGSPALIVLAQSSGHVGRSGLLSDGRAAGPRMSAFDEFVHSQLHRCQPSGPSQPSTSGATAQECRSATLSMANDDECTLHGGSCTVPTWARCPRASCMPSQAGPPQPCRGDFTIEAIRTRIWIWIWG